MLDIFHLNSSRIIYIFSHAIKIWMFCSLLDICFATVWQLRAVLFHFPLFLPPDFLTSFCFCSLLAPPLPNARSLLRRNPNAFSLSSRVFISYVSSCVSSAYTLPQPRVCQHFPTTPPPSLKQAPPQLLAGCGSAVAGLSSYHPTISPSGPAQ